MICLILVRAIKVTQSTNWITWNRRRWYRHRRAVLRSARLPAGRAGRVQRQMRGLVGDVLRQVREAHRSRPEPRRSGKGAKEVERQV